MRGDATPKAFYLLYPQHSRQRHNQVSYLHLDHHHTSYFIASSSPPNPTKALPHLPHMNRRQSTAQDTWIKKSIPGISNSTLKNERSLPFTSGVAIKHPSTHQPVTLDAVRNNVYKTKKSVVATDSNGDQGCTRDVRKRHSPTYMKDMVKLNARGEYARFTPSWTKSHQPIRNAVTKWTIRRWNK
ncbi:hypothetical protein CC80DRAFT_280330 [Byssothecium circinans]|uniref:Uncharacterized protein n=1 Tax=Byssothecium circinans TaxID=147558 RepID=A0A6A5TEG2_9PLEO|nr:hypothetical protein CC80DRAFT_280330 [Byssothecium circinans]